MSEVALLTGGCGFIGSHLLEHFHRKTDWKFIVIDKLTYASKGLDRLRDTGLLDSSRVTFFSWDLCNEFTDGMCKELNAVTYIIHLAADVGGLFKNLDKNAEMFSNNIAINENVLSMCKKYNIKRGIFVLSSCIYTPTPSKFPMDESMIHEGPPHPSNEGYAYAKRMLELQCRQYNKAYGTHFTCVVPVNLYGPYDNFNLQNSHLVPGLMHRFHLDSQKNKDLIAYGTGNPLRQFLYAPDFAEIILKLLFENTYDKAEPLIICNDKGYKIKDIVDNLMDTMKLSKDKIIWDTSKSDGCMKKTVTSAKFRRYYPEYEFTELSEGLTKSYEWFKTNYDTLRK